jgi:hypothetical protein
MSVRKYRTQRAQKLRKRRKREKEEKSKKEDGRNKTMDSQAINLGFLFCVFCATFAPFASGNWFSLQTSRTTSLAIA